MMNESYPRCGLGGPREAGTTHRVLIRGGHCTGGRGRKQNCLPAPKCMVIVKKLEIR